MFFPTWLRLEADPFIGEFCCSQCGTLLFLYADDTAMLASVFVSKCSDLFYPYKCCTAVAANEILAPVFRNTERESLRSFDWPSFNDGFSVHLQVLDLFEQLAEGHQGLFSKCQ